MDSTGNPGVGSINGSTGYVVKNNLWVNNSYGASIEGEEDYNAVLGTYWYGGPSGAHSVWQCVQAGGADPSGNCAGNNVDVAPAASEIFSVAPLDLHPKGNTILGLDFRGVDLGAGYDVEHGGKNQNRMDAGRV